MATKKNRAAGARVTPTLRTGDPESARVVAVLADDGNSVIGAGCLISRQHVLTCLHVVNDALGRATQVGDRVRLQLCGFTHPLVVVGAVSKIGDTEPPKDDLALLTIEDSAVERLSVGEAEFATPFRHGGKSFSVIGFPEGLLKGHYASGVMQGLNVEELVQLDKASAVAVQKGFSGAPVWSPEVGAFVGLVASELLEGGLGWFIPSRVLCRFYPELAVRFRMPPQDRPAVHDFGEDDPNVPLFGHTSETAARRLTVTRVKKERSRDPQYRVDVLYECLSGSPPRGRIVTFITHPSFSSRYEDAYELFSEVVNGQATNYFWTKGPFTLAAVADGGDTALTIDLGKCTDRPKSFV